MPIETKDAIAWALTQTYVDDIGRELPVTKEDAGPLVDTARKYFNHNSIEYSTFSYDDLVPYL